MDIQKKMVVRDGCTGRGEVPAGENDAGAVAGAAVVKTAVAGAVAGTAGGA